MVVFGFFLIFSRMSNLWHKYLQKSSRYTKTCIALIFCVLNFSTKGIAQKSDLGNWIIYLGNKQINKRVNWHSEVQYRNYNIAGDLEQLLIRTAIGYNLTENNNNILLGYGFIRSENYAGTGDTKTGTNEHRIYQQFITKQNFSRVYLQHRYRIEERFLKDDFKLRFRYFLSLNLPLNHAKLTDNTLYLSAYNELFINTERTLFDRNRIYAGLGYKCNDFIKLELGYMNQVFNVNSRDQLNMIANFNF